MSGQSGLSGLSGLSGMSGLSGLSGLSGHPGQSGHFNFFKLLPFCSASLGEFSVLFVFAYFRLTRTFLTSLNNILFKKIYHMLPSYMAKMMEIPSAFCLYIDIIII